MSESYASKEKGDISLQIQSIKENKCKGSWNGNRGRGGYNYSSDRIHQQEGNSSNQRQSTNQSNHRGGGVGRGGGRKLDKIHIHCFKCQ